MLIPNPFYQIYEGAALLAGAEPYYIICSPNNPTDAVLNLKTLTDLIELAQRFDFIIAADECYSEIYFNEDDSPPSLLQAAIQASLNDFRRCLAFHSLSKRSNVPGLRSGFVAGDANIIQQFLRYRTYHGCAMSPIVQAASIVAWSDEQHVIEKRQIYKEKFAAVLNILAPVISISRLTAGFYLWLKTPIPSTHFTRELYQHENVLVLPSSFFAREINGINLGDQRVRLALVAPMDECIEAARRIKNFITTLSN